MQGHVRQRGKDSWELRVYIGRDATTKRARYKTRTFKGSKRDADRAMRAFLAEVDRGVISEGTFGELLERWFEVASTTRDWSPKGIAETRRIIDTRLGALGPIALDKLRTPVIDGYYAQLRTHGGACGHRPRQSHDGDLCEVGPPLSTATVRRIHAVIHSALEQAVAWDMLMFNPASKASPGRIDSPEITSPEVDEVLKLIAAARETDPDFAVYLVVSAVTGARRGEICALRWSDFDSNEATVRFARAISIGAEGPVERQKPKTRSSVRTVALDAATTSILDAHRARCAERALACGVPLPKSAFVFSDEADGSAPWRPDSTTRRFGTLRKRCGLDESIHLHSLRHFVVTTLLNAGVELPEVAGRVGHGGGGRTTLAVYSHFKPARDRHAADYLGQLLALPHGGTV